ncbi:MAG: replication-associated recombination protein A [Gammaproteobacteria bacterium]|nr:replication-associated recombination protein A [Gammaproteobacteria bacterium]
MSLFDDKDAYQPLAAKMRPRCLDDFAGQEHLLAPGKPLRKAIETSSLHSMVLWGPPGVGKTTLARMISELCDVHFQSISAVLAGVKDIREAIAVAQQHRMATGRKTLLFVDEAHRFNKSQQDAFLPYVEDGTLIFVGATTENPSFELNNALLSRARIYKLQSLSTDQLISVMKRALTQAPALKELNLDATPEVFNQLALAADGDARRALNILEVATDLVTGTHITEAVVEEVLGSDFRRFDKGGDIFYEQISALHKAVRGSSPDASLYWFARMLDGGCDPLYIARRVVRMASEDIGNADPRALQLALNAWEVQERLGSPEGELAIAQAIVYLASAAKSNAIYTAFSDAKIDAGAQSSLEVPMHLRNAATKMMENMGYGDGYQYAHDHDDAFVPGESYFPEQLVDREYYHPVDRGLEIKIAEKLAYLKKLNQASTFKRYNEPDEVDG